MSAVDILLTVLLLAAAGIAVRGIVRRKRRGCGCSDCAASCPYRGKPE